MRTRITDMLGIRHPIIQAGMSWASSSAALPAAVSNAGGLGVIAAGPMRINDFLRVLKELRCATDRPHGVNIPLYRPGAAELLDAVFEARVPVVFASQGGPKAHLPRFREIGTRWIQVVSTLEHARKAQAAGVDGLVVVGAEAGGHPPANEVSTLVTVRRVLQEVSIPVIAGGGVADGYGIAALLALGADAVQLGTRFLLTEEASVHCAYKQAVADVEIDGTTLAGRRSLPVRSIRNRFTERIAQAERDNVSLEEYEILLKQGTLKQAALDGDIEWGRVEAGQSAGLMRSVQTVAVVMQQLVEQMQVSIRRLNAMQDAINPCPIVL